MSDAVKCGKCNYVYWTSSWENWGTCPACGRNNDRLVQNENEEPELVGSEWALKYYDPLLDKAQEAIREKGR